MASYPLSGELSRRRLGTESGALRREARAIARAGGNPQKFLEAAGQAKLSEGGAISSAEENKTVQEKKVQAQEILAGQQAGLVSQMSGGGVMRAAAASGTNAQASGTNAQASGTNAQASGTNALPEKKSFAQQDAEARRKSSLSGAFGSESKQIAERQGLFERMQGATPEERGGSLRDEAKKMGISDEGYTRAQFKIAGLDGLKANRVAAPPANQAKADIAEVGLDEAIKRYYQRSADAEKAKAERDTLGKMEQAGREAAGITGNGLPTISAPYQAPAERPELAAALQESAATKERVAARREELKSFAPPTKPVTESDTRPGLEKLGERIGVGAVKLGRGLEAIGQTIAAIPDAPTLASGKLRELDERYIPKLNAGVEAAKVPLRKLAKGFRSGAMQ